MVQNTLFRQCLAAVPEVQKAEFEQTQLHHADHCEDMGCMWKPFCIS